MLHLAAAVGHAVVEKSVIRFCLSVCLVQEAGAARVLRVALAARGALAVKVFYYVDGQSLLDPVAKFVWTLEKFTPTNE